LSRGEDEAKMRAILFGILIFNATYMNKRLSILVRARRKENNMLTKENLHKVYLLLSMLVVGYAIITGLFPDGSIRFDQLRTFTYLSNILLMMGFLFMLTLYNSKGKLRHYVSASVLVAITVTGLVYNFVLVPFANATMVYIGLVNFVTHGLATVLALINYFVFEKKGSYGYKHILVAMIFPAVYWVVFVSIGGFINFYPYFFMNPEQIGWFMVIVWFGILLSVFAILGLLLVLYDKGCAYKIENKGVEKC
jgi:hypothetical protein